MSNVPTNQLYLVFRLENPSQTASASAFFVAFVFLFQGFCYCYDVVLITLTGLKRRRELIWKDLGSILCILVT